MKIVIALTSASNQISGVQRHAINLARCLLTRDEITAVHLIVASWQQECLRSVEPIRDARLHLHTGLSQQYLDRSKSLVLHKTSQNRRRVESRYCSPRIPHADTTAYVRMPNGSHAT